MAAPKGNNFNKKWKTSLDRKKAFKAVCDHIESGLSRQSFPLADWDTVEAYLKDFPEDFPADRLQEAFRRQRLKWEEWGIDGMRGKIPGFNATTWKFNMKNRFPREWRDKQEPDLNHSGDIEVVIGKGV